MSERTEMLICCCCGSCTRGRQWWNRDIGYGLCNKCIKSNGADIEMGKTDPSFGIRGYHYDIPEKEKRIRKWSKSELKKEIMDRINHFYLQTDGTHKFPNSAEGDLLKMVHQLLKPTKRQS